MYRFGLVNESIFLPTDLRKACLCSSICPIEDELGIELSTDKTKNDYRILVWKTLAVW
jgi:hypothetical protein